jgi:hypothetical protein
VVGLSLAIELHTFFRVLLRALLMTVFYAILGWHSFAERQAYIDQLHPFVTRQQIYDQLLTVSTGDVPIEDAFQALCRQVLETQQAYLVAQRPLSPLVGEGLLFSMGAVVQTPDLAGVQSPWISPETICLPLSQEMRGD